MASALLRASSSGGVGHGREQVGGFVPTQPRQPLALLCACIDAGAAAAPAATAGRLRAGAAGSDVRLCLWALVLPLEHGRGGTCVHTCTLRVCVQARGLLPQ